MRYNFGLASLAGSVSHQKRKSRKVQSIQETGVGREKRGDTNSVATYMRVCYPQLDKLPASSYLTADKQEIPSMSPAL